VARSEPFAIEVGLSFVIERPPQLATFPLEAGSGAGCGQIFDPWGLGNVSQVLPYSRLNFQKDRAAMSGCRFVNEAASPQRGRRANVPVTARRVILIYNLLVHVLPHFAFLGS